MNLFNNSEKYFGLFATHSLICSYSGDLSSYQNLAARIGPIKNNSFSFDWKALTADEKAAFYTQNHETDHFKQFISTPFGILIWRNYQVLIRSILYVFNFFKLRGEVVDLKQTPFLTWWRNEGIRRYEKYREKDFNFLPGVITEIEEADKFLDILTCANWKEKYGNYSIGEFIDLINSLYPKLARRSGFGWDIKWKTRLPANSLLFGGGSSCNFNVLVIVEGLSKIREHIALRKNELFETSDLDEWKSKYLHAYYKTGYDYAVENFLPEGLVFGEKKHLGHAYSCLSISLYGNIDISCCTFFQKELYVEDEFPWFIAHHVKNPAVLLVFYERAKATISNILAKNELFTPFSNWDAKEVFFLKESENLDDAKEMRRMTDQLLEYRARHYRLIEGQFFAGLKLIFQSFSSGNSVGNELVELSLVEEYSDTLVFINTPHYDGEEMVLSKMIPLQLGFEQQCTLDSFYGIKTDDPSKIGVKFCASMKDLLKAANINPSAKTLQQIDSFSYFFTKDFLQAFVPVSIDHIFRKD